MASFFRSIRGYFKTRYDGRYFSLLLRELAENEPSSFAKIIQAAGSEQSKAASHWKDIVALLKPGDYVAKVEHSFEGRRKQRRADLAILQDRKAVLLMEVKEFDHLQVENSSQMIDYLAQVRADLGFIYVYRFAPEAAILNRALKLKDQGLPVALLTYDKIYSTLQTIDAQNGAIARLICSYLEDIGVGIYRPIHLRGEHSKATKFLLSQLLCLPHQNGLGKNQSDESVRAGPDLLKRLDGNIEALSEWVRKPNIELMPNRFSRRFWINPKFDLSKLRKALGKASDVPSGELPPRGPWQYVKGGTVCFEATGGLRVAKSGQEHRLYLKIGLALELTPAKSTRPYLYSHFESAFPKGIDLTDVTYHESDYLRTFPSEMIAREELAQTIRGSVKSIIGLQHSSFSALRKFQVQDT